MNGSCLPHCQFGWSVTQGAHLCDWDQNTGQSSCDQNQANPIELSKSVKSRLSALFEPQNENCQHDAHNKDRNCGCEDPPLRAPVSSCFTNRDMEFDEPTTLVDVRQWHHPIVDQRQPLWPMPSSSERAICPVIAGEPSRSQLSP